MGKIAVECTWCGTEVLRYNSQIKKNTYCSKQCRSKHLSKKHNPEGYRKHPHLSELNKKVNPERMTMSIRLKIRESRLNKGTGASYEKTFGQHTHRWVAELMLGRKLKPTEVVHHIDGDKRNNKPSNLMVFPSQSEHLNWHKKHDNRYGGDAI
ncbi:HNH endonuclease [Bacillus sp. CRN 9]|nr:HNH endonuclease [Bacillus sp. CRN 9]